MMKGQRVLVAIDLRSYREALAETFREFIPRTQVFEAEPVDLDLELERLRPDVVICSEVTDLVEAGVPNWVELYPGGGVESVASIGGKRTIFESIQLADLFSIFDQLDMLPQGTR